MAKVSEILTRLSLDSEKFKTELQKASSTLKSFGTGAQDVGKDMMVAGGLISAPLILAVKQASNMEETLNKFDVVFGASSESVRKWADDLGESVGRGKEQMYRFVSDMQDFFVPMGFGAQEAQKLSEQVTKLAVDVASFNNKTDDEALTDLRAALSGSGEVMKKYGVILNETTIAQKAYQQGLDPQAISEQQKAQIRMQVILEGTKAAHGDAERSAGSFANQMKRLQGELSNTAGTVGSALLPAATSMVSALTGLLTPVANLAKSAPWLVTAVGGIGAALTVGGAGVYAAGTLFSKVGAIFANWPQICMAASGGVRLLTAAVSKLSAGLIFLVTTPVGWAILAAAAAFMVMRYAVNANAEALAEQSRQAGEAAAKAREQREESDSQARASLGQFERLKVLSSLESQTDATRLESSQILADLTARYGDLGLSIDETTGKISGLDKAQSQLNKTILENRMMDLNVEGASADRELETLEKELEFKSGYGYKLASTFSRITGEYDVEMSKLADKIADVIDKKNDIMFKKIRTRQGLSSGEADTALNGSSSVNLLTADVLKKLNTDIAKQEKEIAERKMTDVEKEIAAVRRLHEEYQKNLTVLQKNAEAKKNLAQQQLETEQASGDDQSVAAARTALKYAEEELDKVNKTLGTVADSQVATLFTGLKDVQREVAEALLNGYQREVNALNKTFDERKAKLEGTLNEMKRLESSGQTVDAGKKETVQSNLAQNEEGRFKALRELQDNTLKDVRREIGESLVNEYQREVSGINKAFDERKKKLEEVLSEYKRLQAAGVDGTIGESQKVETDLSQNEIGRQKALDEAKSKRSRTFTDMNESFSRQESEGQKRYADSREEAALDKQFKENPAAALGKVQSLMSVAQQAMQSAAQEYRKAVANASQDSVLTPEEQKNIDSKKHAYDLQTSDFERYRGRFDRIKDDLQSAPAKTAGAFNAEAAARLSGQTLNPALDTAKATKETAKLTSQYLRYLKELADMSRSGSGSARIIFT